MSRPRRTTALGLASALLLVVGAMYVVRGGYHLVVRPEDPMEGIGVDLRARWKENRYVFRGKNPYDVAETTIQRGLNRHDHVEAIRDMSQNRPPPTDRDAEIDADIGVMTVGGYPPWSFLTAAAVVLPVSNYQLTQLCFIAINLVSAAVVAVWAYRVGRPLGLASAALLAGSTLALISNYTVIRAGQYGIVINALLVGALWMESRARGVPSGVCLGMALLKPHIGWLFWPVFLVRRQYGVLLSALLYVSLATVTICWLTRTGPLEMLQQANRQTGGYAAMDGDSLLRILYLLGVPSRTGTIILGLSGLGIALVLMARCRHCSILALYAIASVFGRLATYHHRYDNTMMVFLLVAAGRLALSRPSKGNITLFVLTGFTLWLPSLPGYLLGSMHAFDIFLSINHVITAGIWMVTLAAVLGDELRQQAASAPVPPASDTAVDLSLATAGAARA